MPERLPEEVSEWGGLDPAGERRCDDAPVVIVPDFDRVQLDGVELGVDAGCEAIAT